MDDAAELAGFFAAHAVWCVASGETLVPLIGMLTRRRERQMTRLDLGAPEKAVAYGTELLEKNPERLVAAALIYDGYVTLQEGKTDALVVEVRDYVNDSSLQVVVPYRHASAAGGFTVYRPKIRAYKGPDTDLNIVGQRFFDGVAQHTQAAEVWSKHLDESR